MECPSSGVPKTVDNDLLVTEYCIGFDTAVAIVTEAVDRLHTTAASHHRVMVVEAMGREAGWVTLMGGLAGGADMIIIPEFSSGSMRSSSISTPAASRPRPSASSPSPRAQKSSGLPTASDSDAPLDAFGHAQLSRRGIGERLGRQVEDVTGFETQGHRARPHAKGWHAHRLRPDLGDTGRRRPPTS